MVEAEKLKSNSSPSIMTSVEKSTAATAATAPPQSASSVTAVNVYCVEATTENTEKVRALLDRLHNGEVPTADTLARAGMKGLELTAGVEATIAEVRGVVQRQRLSGTATATTTVDDAHLSFFAVSRGGVTAAQTAQQDSTEMEAASSDEGEPLVALPDELSLGEVLKSPHVWQTAAATGAAAMPPTLLLFYASSTKWGGCCCCGGLVSSIVSFFCGCCGHRRQRQRSPRRHSRTNSGNPLNNSSHSNAGYYPAVPAGPAAGYTTDNTFYTQYGSPNANPNYGNANYAPVPQAQMYYPPPPVSNSSNDGGGYYKPV